MLTATSLSRFFLLPLRLNPSERLIRGSLSQSQKGALVWRAKLGISRSLLADIFEGACWVALWGSRVQIPAARWNTSCNNRSGGWG